MPEHHFITGVAGFIGSHLADALLADGCHVSGIDDFSLGREENLALASRSNCFKLIRGDARDARIMTESLQAATETLGDISLAWHLAANSDISAGVADPTIDFERTLQTTFATAQAGKTIGVKRIAFASTSAVYGELQGTLTEESAPLLPISNYGATKLASEALLSAAAETSLDRLWIFRFPNVVGPRSTHGAIHDFAHRLAKRPDSLKVLGDGTQQKPYLHVSELIEAMRFIVKHAEERRNLYLIGPEGPGTQVSFMAESSIDRMAPGTPINYTGGDRGWVGDVPRFSYSTEKLRQLGWKPQLDSDGAILRAIDDVARDLGF